MWNDYVSPVTLAEALAVLKEKDGQARVIAGGTDLSLQAQRSAGFVGTAVDVTGIPGMADIALDGAELVLGACVTHGQAADSPLVRRHASALAAASAAMGSPQIRNAGTLGGNIVNAQPAADSVIALLALDATVVVAGQSGERRAPIGSLFTGPGRSAIDPTREIVVQVRVPAARGRERSAFARLARRRALSLPTVNAAVAVKPFRGRIQWARIAIGPVAPVPFRADAAEAALKGAALSVEAVERAAELAAAASDPRSSLLRGSREYRKRVVRVLVRRALMEALGLV